MPATQERLLAFLQKPGSEIVTSQDHAWEHYSGPTVPHRLNGSSPAFTAQLDVLRGELTSLAEQGRFEECETAAQRGHERLIGLNRELIGCGKSVELDAVRQWITPVMGWCAILQ